jgi:NADPH:quinone reductase-like Zn-dependent oxidoreductase
VAFTVVDPELFTTTATELVALIQQGLRPHIGATYDLADAAKGLAAIEGRAIAGKVVIRVR